MIDPKKIKNKIANKNNLYCLFVILIIFFLDRYTKIYILNNFSDNLFYFNDFINFDLVWNTGIGFGIFSSNSEIVYNFISLFISIVIIILIYLSAVSNVYDKIIYSIIIGGALGNFYDRMLFKAVPDFVDLHFDNFHWFTFNVADIFITIGVMTYIIRSFFIKN